MYDEIEMNKPRDLYSRVSEQALLGTILVRNSVIHDVEKLVCASDFFVCHHRWIFEAIQRITGRGNIADVATVTEELVSCGRSGDNAAAYLSDLANRVTSTENAIAYAQAVRDKKSERDMMEVARKITDIVMASDGSSTVERIQRAEEAFSSIKKTETHTTQVKLHDALVDYVNHLDWRFNNPGPHGLQTGYKPVDERLGGMNGGELIVIGGRPAMGKTTYGMNVVTNIAMAGKRAMVFSLEMPARQLSQRMIASVGRIPLKALKDASALGDGEMCNRVVGAVSRIKDLDVEIDDQGGLDIADLCSRARRANAEKKLDVILVDYLQLVNDRSAQSRFEVVSAVSRKLKALAKELDCPIIALSQLSRKIEERPVKDRKPVMSDLRESGQIEQDADVIQFVYREEVYDENSSRRGVLDLITAKFRDGEIGEDALAFDGSINLISELSADHYRQMQQEDERPSPKRGQVPQGDDYPF